MAVIFSEMAKNLSRNIVNVTVVDSFHSSFSSSPLETSVIGGESLEFQTRLENMSKRNRDQEGIVALQNLAKAFKFCVNRLLNGVFGNWLNKWITSPDTEFLNTPIEIAQQQFPELRIFEGDKVSSLTNCVKDKAKSSGLDTYHYAQEGTCLQSEFEKLRQMLVEYDKAFKEVLEARRKSAICFNVIGKNHPDFPKLQPMLLENHKGVACERLKEKDPPACVDKMCDQYVAEKRLDELSGKLRVSFQQIQAKCIIDDESLKANKQGRKPQRDR